jgi:hypothetical protein
MGEGWRFDAICIGKVKTRVLKPEAYGTRVKTNAEFWLKLQNFYDLECETGGEGFGDRAAGAAGRGGVNEAVVCG